MGRRKQKASLGMLFWLAVILLIAVIFLYNRRNIEQVLENTGLMELISQRVERDTPALIVQTVEDEVPDAGQPAEDGQLELTLNDTLSEPSTESSTRVPDVESNVEPEPADELPIPTRVRESAIYFIRVNDTGDIQPIRVIRAIAHSNSPMTNTMKSLLKGPTHGELSEGLLNLIPQQTELLSAWIENGIAYLNFNEAFLFNPIGFEGTVAQLQQIVYSVTEFSTIGKVQILIEGNIVEYLGTEGVYIGAPLARDSFEAAAVSLR